VLLLLTLFPPNTAIAACRWGMSIVYIWSGIQKCNGKFFQTEPAFFAGAALHWHLPPFALDFIRGAVACAPFIELSIGLALWLPRLRLAAIIAAVVIHGTALLVLGPLGYNYNWVVWPWNLAMPALLWVLFAKGMYWEQRPMDTRPAPVVKEEKPRKKGAQAKTLGPATKKNPTAAPGASLKQTFAELRRAKPALAIVTLYSLLPILSYFGLWDSYFSFSLYSDNSATANVFITQQFADRLPARMKAQVQNFKQAYDPQHQGPFVFIYGGWCYEELHVPPIAEPRNFLSIFKALQAFSTEPSDLRMIVGQRYGPVIFYEGDSREFLTPQ
jgi:uncharacterized membrane protein YphA (DoxX/SURF4 family)